VQPKFKVRKIPLISAGLTALPLILSTRPIVEETQKTGAEKGLPIQQSAAARAQIKIHT